MEETRLSVLVTGGAGYIGSHTVLALLDAGYRVVIFDDQPQEGFNRLDPRAVFIAGSIANASLLRMVLEYHRVTAILHCADILSGDAQEGDPGASYRRNVAAFITLMECAAAHGVAKLVLLSSTAVYGPDAGATPDELATPVPRSILGRSHWMAEQILADFAKAHSMSACIVRAGLIAGADPLWRPGPASGAVFNPVVQALEVALGRRVEAIIYTCPGATSDGTVVRSYVHVADLAKALVAATAHAMDNTSQVVTYNCGNLAGYSDRAVLEAVGRITAMRIRHRAVPCEQDVPAEQNANSQAIRRSLGWAPQYTGIDDLVRDTLRGGTRKANDALGRGGPDHPSLYAVSTAGF